MESKTSVVESPRPLPRIARFENFGYGLFLHWGLYSQLGRGEWVMHREAIPPTKYNKLARTFSAADFDASAWARLAKASGMAYAAITTRHHDGFSLYDTLGLSSFDAPHSAASRDLVAEFVQACRSEGIVPFFYHTTLDWQWNSAECDAKRFDAYLEYLHASVEILCKHYGEIGGFWFDGNWSIPNSDWQESRLYSMIRRFQPDAIIVNNTGLAAKGARGHPELDSVTFEQGIPVAVNRAGWPKYLACEMCQTMNQHWGMGASDINYISPAHVVRTLALCRKVGANYLLNVGPLAQGGIPEYEGAALRRAGDWVHLNASILRDCKPAPEFKCDGDDFVLRSPDARRLYYFAFGLPVTGDAHVTAQGGKLHRAISGFSTKLIAATWRDNGKDLEFVQHRSAGFVALELTGFPYGTDLVVRVAEFRIGRN